MDFFESSGPLGTLDQDQWSSVNPLGNNDPTSTASFNNAVFGQQSAPIDVQYGSLRDVPAAPAGSTGDNFFSSVGSSFLSAFQQIAPQFATTLLNKATNNNAPTLQSGTRPAVTTANWTNQKVAGIPLPILALAGGGLVLFLVLRK